MGGLFNEVGVVAQPGEMQLSGGAGLSKPGKCGC